MITATHNVLNVHMAYKYFIKIFIIKLKKYLCNVFITDLLLFSTDSWTGRAGLTGGTLEFGVSALASATFTRSSAVTDLLVAGPTRAVVQRTITGTSGPHGVTDTHSALTASMS